MRNETGMPSGSVFNFMPMGQAIKRERERRGITREQLAEMLDYAPRHLQSIENEGQHPSLQLFVQLVTMFDISVDPFLFPDEMNDGSAKQLQMARLLPQLTERELTVLEATAYALLAAREESNEQKG